VISERGERERERLRGKKIKRERERGRERTREGERGRERGVGGERERELYRLFLFLRRNKSSSSGNRDPNVCHIEILKSQPYSDSA